MPDANSPTESVVSVENVIKEFGPLRVLDGVEPRRGARPDRGHRRPLGLGQEHAAALHRRPRDGAGRQITRLRP